MRNEKQIILVKKQKTKPTTTAAAKATKNINRRKQQIKCSFMRLPLDSQYDLYHGYFPHIFLPLCNIENKKEP